MGERIERAIIEANKENKEMALREEEYDKLIDATYAFDRLLKNKINSVEGEQILRLALIEKILKQISPK